MKKDFTRDYTTEIFRAYAAAGMPTYEAARERVYTEYVIDVGLDGDAGDTDVQRHEGVYL